MAYAPLEDAIPLPKKSRLPALLRSPSETEVQEILAAFVPAHAQYDKLMFTRLLQSWLENRGLALSYRLKAAALGARQRTRNRDATLKANRT